MRKAKMVVSQSPLPSDWLRVLSVAHGLARLPYEHGHNADGGCTTLASHHLKTRRRGSQELSVSASPAADCSLLLEAKILYFLAASLSDDPLVMVRRDEPVTLAPTQQGCGSA